MNFTVVTTPDSDADLLEICEWYDTQSNDLDIEFLGEFRALTEQIRTFPHSFPIIYKDIHQALLSRFPYKILFLINEGDKEAVIIAAIHNARHPRVWKRRV